MSGGRFLGGSGLETREEAGLWEWERTAGRGVKSQWKQVGLVCFQKYWWARHMFWVLWKFLPIACNANSKPSLRIRQKTYFSWFQFWVSARFHRDVLWPIREYGPGSHLFFSCFEVFSKFDRWEKKMLQGRKRAGRKPDRTGYEAKDSDSDGDFWIMTGEDEVKDSFRSPFAFSGHILSYEN